MRIMNHAVQNKLSVDLLSIIQLKHLVLTKPELQNSYYKYEPTLIYELGELIVTRIDHEPNFYIHAMIIIPRLLQVPLGYVMELA